MHKWYSGTGPEITLNNFSFVIHNFCGLKMSVIHDDGFYVFYEIYLEENEIKLLNNVFFKACKNQFFKI